MLSMWSLVRSRAVQAAAPLMALVAVLVSCGDDTSTGQGSPSANGASSSGGATSAQGGSSPGPQAGMGGSLAGKAGGSAQGGAAQGGSAQGGSAQSGSAQGGSAQGGAGAGSGGAPVGGTLCDAYITCASETDPVGLAAVLAAYGKAGSCWAQGDVQLCEKACGAGLVQMHKAHPDVASCNHCDADADCVASAPGCDVASHQCKACTKDAQCSTYEKPACDPVSFSCVGCTSDAHCGMGRPIRCHADSMTCVQCATDADCGGPFGPGGICDVASGSCHPCLVDADCKAGKCSVATGQCVQCTSDADCGGATPRCLSQGYCAECTSDADCSVGICNTIGGFCCGKDACVKQGVVCGAALDFSCSLLPIPCAVCPGDEHCHGNACQPPPTDECGADHKCPGQCAYDPKANRYFCTDLTVECPISVDGKVDPESCGPGFVCETYDFNGSKYSECNNYCLSDADCGNSPGACQMVAAKGVGVCRYQ